MHKLLLSLFVILLLSGCDDQLTDARIDAPADAVATSDVDFLSKTHNAQQCDVNVPGDHATIQAAVDAAASGAVVCVNGSGTYTEQVLINKDLDLVGVGNPTVIVSASSTAFTIPESGTPLNPIIFGFGGTLSGEEVTGSGTVDVSVSGFTIDGNDQQAAGREVAIFFRNVQSTRGITQNTVNHMAVGGQETFGILAYGDSKVTIDSNTINGYERGGIGANGNGADPAPDVVISNNTVTGSTGIGEAWAPNGIQVGYGAGGQITNNVVSDNRWAPTEGDWSASCIIIFESDNVEVSDNQVSNCDIGVTVGSWGWFRPSADNVHVKGNDVQGAGKGVKLEVVAWNNVSSFEPSVSNTKVVRNTLDGGLFGEIGIQIETFDDHPDLDEVAWNNKAINNEISGFVTSIDEGGTDTKVASNDGPASP